MGEPWWTCDHGGIGLPGCPTCDARLTPEGKQALRQARDEMAALLARVEEATGLNDTIALLYADREALWRAVREASAILRVTDDSEDDWPKLPHFAAALLARAEAAEAENARLRGLALRIADALDEAFDALALLGRDVTMDEFIYAAGGRTVAAIEPACGGLRAKAAALRKMAALAEVNHG